MHRDSPIGKGVFQPLGEHVALEGRAVPSLPVVNSRGDLHGLYDDWLLAVSSHAHPDRLSSATDASGSASAGKKRIERSRECLYNQGRRSLLAPSDLVAGSRLTVSVCGS